MELKEWIEKYKNWFIYPISILVFYYFISKRDDNKKTKPTQVENVSEAIPLQTPVLNQQEIEENKIKQEKEEKVRKNEEEKERITGCLVGNFDGDWGTYSFSSNGVFSWEVSTGPYQQYREGTWKYIGGNKVKLNKSWIPRSGTITISKYCEVFGLNF